MAENPRTIAVFDFDGTLIKGDSLYPFLKFAGGPFNTVSALTEALLLFLMRRIENKNDPDIADPRTFLKAYLLEHVLCGKATGDLAPALEKLRLWRRWNEPVKQALLGHKEKGHHILIISGALDLYLPELVKDIPHDGLICTQVEINDGLITGAMPEGNCVRERKAELLAAYMTEHGPFEDSFGYGNAPHDLPMLKHVKHQKVI